MSAPANLRPSFVLSSARAGSTLLRLLLDTHPDLACPAELNLGELISGLYRAYRATLGELAGGSERERDEATWEAVREHVEGWMRRYASGRGKRGWCEKTPANLAYLPTLTRVFPEARYLCLYRRCEDVVLSSLEAGGVALDRGHREGEVSCLDEAPEQPPSEHQTVALVDYWLDCTTRMLALEAEAEISTFRLRYEDLVAGPEEVLAPLCRYLGVEWRRELLEQVFHQPHDHGRGDSKALLATRIYSGSVGRGAGLLSSLDSGRRSQVEAQHQKLGYELRLPAAAGPELAAASRPRGTGPQAAMEWIESEIPRRLLRLKARGYSYRGSAQLEVPGLGRWRLELEGEGKVIRGGEGGQCSLRLGGDDLLLLASGQVEPVALLAAGRLVVSGEREVVDLLGWLLSAGAEQGGGFP